jgi:hypothetical protein
MTCAVAIPSWVTKRGYPRILVESLQRQRPLRNIEKSGWRDSNPRPLEPHSSALPSCATARSRAEEHRCGGLPVQEEMVELGCGMIAWGDKIEVGEEEFLHYAFAL